MENKESIPPKRFARRILAIIGLAFIVLQVWTTEARVGELRADGFSEVAISSERNHAYLPMIGALVGSLLFIGIFKAFKSLFRQDSH